MPLRFLSTQSQSRGLDPIMTSANSSLLWFEDLTRVENPSLRLFCFPHAGGSVDVYRGWRKALPEQIDMCLVHLPGRGRRTRERAFTQLDGVVNAVADRMSVKTEIAYALYGHSMGALISFELGRELFRRHGAGPAHLFISGHCAPQDARKEPPLSNLPHDEFIIELKRLNGTPRNVLDNRELMDIFVGVLRADFKVVEHYEYRPGNPLSCPMQV